ncbi:hypothetical protein C2E23DRAFT_838972 [Lenzites betulinus]|nr:hypothetical protein C2E23DRAFT_838972 [Lenzites betulinus]
MADYSDILPGPYINYDIFLELLTHIPRQTDMMALMSTCKILWADGIKPLLAFGVIIRTPSALRSFCTFMLSDIPVRAPLLRRLYLAIPLDPELEMEDEDDEDDLDPCLGRAFASLSKDLVKMFARVMEKTTNIEDLSIDSAEEIFDRDEEECLAAAVVALRHIRRMHIGSIRDTAQEILGQVKSPLLELDLDCSDARAVDFLPRITVMAQYYTRTLQKLTTLRGELYLTEADLVDYADLVDHADDDNDGNHGTNNDGDAHENTRSQANGPNATNTPKKREHAKYGKHNRRKEARPDVQETSEAVRRYDTNPWDSTPIPHNTSKTRSPEKSPRGITAPGLKGRHRDEDANEP